MPIKPDCFGKLHDKDLEEYLHSKAEEHIGKGMSEKDAYKKAARELQEKSIDAVKDIYSSIGIKGYEKSTPNETPNQKADQGDQQGQLPASKETIPTEQRTETGKEKEVADLEAEKQKKLERPYKQIQSQSEKDREYQRISGEYPKTRELINAWVDYRIKQEDKNFANSDQSGIEFTNLDNQFKELLNGGINEKMDNEVNKNGKNWEDVRKEFLDKYSEENRHENKVEAEYQAKLKAVNEKSKSTETGKEKEVAGDFTASSGNKVIDEKGEPLIVYRSQEDKRDQGVERQSKLPCAANRSHLVLEQLKQYLANQCN